MHRVIYAVLLVITLTGSCAARAAPTPPAKSTIQTSPYAGPIFPRALATDDGQTILVGGDTVGDGPPATSALAAIALSADGGASWTRATLAAGRINGAAIRVNTLWVTVDCSGEVPCMLFSTDGGRSWQASAVGPSNSPSLAGPTSGMILTPLHEGRATAFASEDRGASFAEDGLVCGSDRSPVSISLDGPNGVVACRTNGDLAVDYDDDWLLRERRGGGWEDLYDPASASGPYDPEAPPSLSTSWINWISRRRGWALLSSGAGYYRSADDGATWLRIEGDDAGFPLGLPPIAANISADGSGVGLVISLSGQWWIIRTTTKGESWTTVASFER